MISINKNVFDYLAKDFYFTESSYKKINEIKFTNKFIKKTKTLTNIKKK
jgi:hypothetical protein